MNKSPAIIPAVPEITGTGQSLWKPVPINQQKQKEKGDIIMSRIVPFNHKKSLTTRDPLANMLDDFFDDEWFPRRTLDLETFKLDVKEDKNQYVIEAELPGVKKKDISLDFVDGRLTIGVAEKKVADEDKHKLIHRERRYSYMERSIYLADAVCEKAEAKLEHGELIITVPRAKNEDNTQKIEIQ